MKKSLLLIISALLFSGVATAQYFNTKGYYVPAEDFNFLFQPNESNLFSNFCDDLSHGYVPAR